MSAVVEMAHGSVIVDMAAEQGGNCALTERDKIVEKYDVTIIGLTDLPSRMARQSSDLYATVVFNLLKDVSAPAPNAAIALNLEDEIHRGVLVLKSGELMWPPPKPPPARIAPAAAPKPEAKPAEAPKPASGGGRIFAAVVAVLLGLAGIYGPPEFIQHLTVFLLACVVGWHVIWNVTPALHTPLMSVTNAISGIIVVGGMLVLFGQGPGSLVLGGIAVLVASINVSGGFLVTQRMLRMFRK
jgi:NAD(P) transhydrogenase subunit alpha